MEQLVEQIEKVVLQFVGVEADDLSELAELHSQLGKIQEQAGQAASLAADQQEIIQKATSAAGNLIEQIILQDTDDEAEALRIVGETCESLQKLLEQISQGDHAAVVEFPAELKISQCGKNPESTQAVTEKPKLSLPENVDEEIFREFLSNQSDVLSNLESAILATEQDTNQENLNTIAGILHNLKGEAGLMGLQEISGFCHETESMLIDAGNTFPAEKLFAAKDWLQEAIAQLSGVDAGNNSERPDPTSGEKCPAPKAEVTNNQEAGKAEASQTIEEITITEDDVSLVMDFISESNEHLESAEADILTIEENPEDMETINAIFRAFHTIKGVAGFLNFKQIGTLAHAAENLLDMARKGKVVLGRLDIDAIFRAIDVTKKMLDPIRRAVKVRGSVIPYNSEQLQDLIERIESCAAGKPLGPRIGEILVESGYISGPEMYAVLRKQKKHGYQKKLGEMLVEDQLITQEQLEQALRQQRILVKGTSDKNEKLELSSAVSMGTESTATPSTGEKRNGPEGRKISTESTIKITTARLDSLINMVGELMVTQSMVGQDLDEYLDGNQRLERNSRQLNKITRDLQELSMSMRMVPVQGVFQKMARLVRDLSRKAGKEIDFKMEGADTELDRNVVESVADPLVHMVRNSIDHGVESPQQREEAGKPRTGQIKLSAYHQGGNIVIEIADDGKGLDRERILQKAVKCGVVKEGQELSDQEIYRLIFHAGLSTAEKVTDISGRGVGMDVVRKNIEALRGRVDIDSAPGRGTVFSIRLPLTLAVIDGQIVTISNEKYIIPLLAVERSLRPSREQLSSLYGGKAETLMVQGDLLPLIRLYNLFNIEPRTIDPCEGLVVIVADGAKRCCLLVDDLADQQQVVIKSLGSYLGSIQGVSGGAIMGDGNVALILDVPGLIQLAQVSDAIPVAAG